MRRISKIALTLLVSLSVMLSFSLFTVNAEESDAELDDQGFIIDIYTSGNAGPGETVNVICSVKDITAKNGLIAISFTLDYNCAKVRPAVVSEKPGDSSPYDEFIIRSPQYIMDLDGTEISASCYENNSICYSDGCFRNYYDFVFYDKETYPMKKDGTDPDPVIRKDGDFVLSIPFIVLDYVPAGEVIFTLTSATGTDAGNDVEGPSTVTAPVASASFMVLGDSFETSFTNISAGSSEAPTVTTDNAENTTESTKKQTFASESVTTIGEPADISASIPLTQPDSTPKTSDNGVGALALSVIVSLVLSVCVIKIERRAK